MSLRLVRLRLVSFKSLSPAICFADSRRKRSRAHQSHVRHEFKLQSMCRLSRSALNADTKRFAQIYAQSDHRTGLFATRYFASGEIGERAQSIHAEGNKSMGGSRPGKSGVLTALRGRISASYIEEIRCGRNRLGSRRCLFKSLPKSRRSLPAASAARGTLRRLSSSKRIRYCRAND